MRSFIQKKGPAWFVIMFLLVSLLGILGRPEEKRICATVGGVQYSYDIKDGGIHDLKIEKINLSSERIPMQVKDDTAYYTISVPGVLQSGNECYALASISQGFFSDRVVTGSAVSRGNLPATSGAVTASGSAATASGGAVATESAVTPVKNYHITLDFSDTALQDIPAYAFSDQKSEVVKLNRVTGLDQVKRVGDYAFYQCVKIDSLSLPSCVRIGGYAFSGAQNLKKISTESLEMIEEYAFYRSGIERFSADKLQSIGKNAFADCGALEVFEADQLAQIGDKAFSDSGKLQMFKSDKLTELGECSFVRCEGLKSVSVGNLECVPAGAFYGCTDLERFYADNVTVVSEDAFNSCSSLQSVSLPAAVSIGQYAFLRCSSLLSFSADTLEHVAVGAFQECRSLEYFQAKSLYDIGDYAFYQSDRNNRVASKLFRLGILKSIGKGAFKNCNSLTYLSTEFLESIGANAFSGSGLKKCYLYAESVPADAFEGASQLTLFCMNPNTDFLHEPDGTLLEEKQAVHALDGVRVVGYTRCTISDMMRSQGVEGFKDFSVYRKETGDGSYIPKNATSYKVLFSYPDGLYQASFVSDPQDDQLLQRTGYAYVPVEKAEFSDEKLVMRSLPQVSGPAGFHYHFDGYYCQNTRIVSADGVFITEALSSLKDADNVLIAAFSSDTYRITYENSFFKTGYIAAAQYSYGQGCTLPDASDMERTGYSFAGWKAVEGYLSDDVVAEIPAGTDKDVTLEAQWMPKKYSVIYDGAGGRQDGMERITDQRTYGTDYILQKCSFIRPGYSFKGWMDQNGNDITSVCAAGDVIVYAKWVPVQYSITYESEGTVTWKDRIDHYTVESETFDLPDPVRKGYVFEGWKCGDEKISRIEKGTTGDVVVSAVWSPENYQICYQWNGGLAAVYPESYTYGKEVILPDAKRDGYTFGGWYLTASFSGNSYSRISADTIGDVTLYARWIPVTYTITLDLNASDAVCSVSTISYTVETERDLADPVLVPVRNGYTFAGWYKDGVRMDHIKMGSQGDYILTAQWEKRSYDVKYVLNGGTIRDTSYTDRHIYGQQENLPENVARSGYTFCGWYDNERFEGSPVTQIDALTGGCTFYAKWKAKTYIYRYYYTDDNGSRRVIEKEVIYGTEIPYPEIQLKDCKLEKWQETTGGTQGRTLEKGDRAYITGNREFTAVMRSIHMYLIFDAQGGTCEEAQKEVFYGEKAGALPAAVKDGYEFTGWVTASGIRYSSETVITFKEGNGLILYATYRRYESEKDEITNDIEQKDSMEDSGDAVCVDDAIPTAGDTETAWYKAPVTGVYYEMLSASEKKLYAGLYNYYQDGKHMGDAYTCMIHDRVDVLQIQNALQAFMFDHKEISWIGGANFSIERKDDETRIQFGITAGYDYELVLQSYKAISSSDEYDKLLAGIDIKKNDSAAEKVRKIADAVADYIVYTSDVGADGRYSSKYRDAAYVVFVQKEHEAVCVAYAILFQQICRYYDIDCIVVSGTTSTGGHAWNYVKIGRLWYGVDVTWYDSDREGDYILSGTEKFNSYDRKYNTPVIGKDLLDVVDLSRGDYKEDGTGKNEGSYMDDPTVSESPNETGMPQTTEAGAAGSITGGGNTSYVEDTLVEDTLMGDEFVYSVKGQTITISGLTSVGRKKGVLVIPDTLGKGYFVKIKKGAFANASVKSVTLGDGVKQICQKAFMGCKKLKTVTIRSRVLKKVEKKVFSSKVVVKVPKKKKKAYRKLFSGQKAVLK